MFEDKETWTGTPSNPWERGDYALSKHTPDGYDDGAQMLYAAPNSRTDRPQVLYEVANRWRLHAMVGMVLTGIWIVFFLFHSCKPRRKYTRVHIEG
jgi:hypothetical protein